MGRKVATLSLGGGTSILFCGFLIFFLKPAPTYAQFTLEAQIPFLEEQTIGTYVGDVIVSSNLFNYVDQADRPLLQYSLQKSTGDFNINERYGTLSSARVIDRDTICAGEDTCFIDVEVLVYRESADGIELIKVIKVQVEIIDINDNPPEFLSKSLTLRVPENNALDEELRTSSAEDKDTGENGVKSYSFQDPTDTFTLKVHSNEDGSTYLGIVIKEKLDREKRDSYEVVVIATDGGKDTRRTGSVVINITVTDLNDNKPLFDQPSYNVSVPEDITVNVPIVHLKATDKDIGSNAEISYQIGSQVSAEIRRIFYIDEQTGEIFTRSNLDYEVDRRYQLVVEAIDHGSPPESSRVSVTLNVADVNDNAPQISINLPPQGADISEVEPVGEFIAHVTVLDKDQGRNKRVTCSLNDNHFALEKFGSEDSDMFKVVLSRPLDHEKYPSHRVNISCTDSGQPPKSNSTIFVVNVTDVNDVRPAFEQDTYRGSIPENHRGVMEVLTVKAHDWDSGDMGRVTYSLEDRYNGLFVIHPNTGVISVTRAVDRENGAASLEFHVIARDNGRERLTSSALVVVEVEDENDEPPRFTRPSFFGEVLENQPVGTHVGNVTATDPDSAVNGKIRYAILQQGTDFSKFSINSDTGEMKSAAVFDRENNDRFFLTVQAVDPENSDFYSTCNFTVRVLDDNDHTPVITSIVGEADEDISSGDSSNATFIVQYNAPVGSIITRVLAHDGDDIGSPNAQLYYDISSGDPEHLFSINRFTGALALSRIVTAKDIKTFKLTITVSDGGDPPQSDSQNVYIKVNGSIAALAGASSGGISQNILIVIILIGVTIVLALAILATICLIRKIDRQRRLNRASQKLSEDKMYQLTTQGGKHGQNNHQDVFANRGPLEREDEDRDRTSPGVANSNSYSNNLSKRGGGIGGGGGGGGGKKEVSFSLDEETDSHNTSSGSAHPLTSFKGGGSKAADRQDGGKAVGSRPVRNGVMNIPVSGDKPGNVRRSPQNDECQLIEILKKSAEDALSESSGETDPSDSGRGGSEDECSHRGSGIDPEQCNGRIPHSKGHRSPSHLKDKDQHHHRQQQQQQNQNHHHENNNNNSNNARNGHLQHHPAGPSRQLSSSSTSSATPGGTPSMKGRPRSRLLEPTYHSRENTRDSLTSDFGSDFSGSRPPSQSRTDSDRSVPPPPPAPRPTRDPPISQMLPFTRPAPIPTSHSYSSSPSPRDLRNNLHNNMGYTLPSSRALFSRDSPNRLAGPHQNNSSSGSNIPHSNHNGVSNSNYNNSLLRSFHGQRSILPRQQQQQNQIPHLSSVSLERLPRSSSSASSSAGSNPAPYYSDRAAGGGGFYPSIPDRWDRTASSIMTEEDDRTTTSGSYTINPDDLRQEIDELILQDSIV